MIEPLGRKREKTEKKLEVQLMKMSEVFCKRALV